MGHIGAQTMLERIKNRMEYEQILINNIERVYQKQPNENIADLKREDHQDYSDWRKLPRLITTA